MAIVVKQKTRSPFGNLFREALDEKDASLRGLARKLVGLAPGEEDDGRGEAKRRLLQKYVTGEVSPGPSAREELAEALGIDPARFALDQEREEQRKQIMNALIPLADQLLEIATAARKKAEK
jgi:hypothetical protein